MRCVHCHVNAGPHRQEEMDRETIDLVLDICRAKSIAQLDITGGAPELNPHFRYLINNVRKCDIEVIDRCNLTILLEPEHDGLIDFLAMNEIRIIASLPCYREENVDKQRGRSTFEKSIQALKLLNQIGYGISPALKLDLVFNPLGPELPPAQCELKQIYKKELGTRFGIFFNDLFTITNMPINRFGATLQAHNRFEEYIEMLEDNFEPKNLDSIMCRDTISVDWRGYLYDCDFNQMLQENIVDNGTPLHLRDWLDQPQLDSKFAITGRHCFGCTAGQGSSCQGALVSGAR